jgi:hypothetical protein
MESRSKPWDIHSLPDLTPKHDDRFSELLEGAVSGSVPIYFGLVPIFDTTS